MRSCSRAIGSLRPSQFYLSLGASQRHCLSKLATMGQEKKTDKDQKKSDLTRGTGRQKQQTQDSYQAHTHSHSLSLSLLLPFLGVPVDPELAKLTPSALSRSVIEGAFFIGACSK